MVMYPVKPDGMWTYQEEAARIGVLTVHPLASGKVIAGFTEDMRAKVYVASSLSKLWDSLHNRREKLPSMQTQLVRLRRCHIGNGGGQRPWRQKHDRPPKP